MELVEEIEKRIKTLEKVSNDAKGLQQKYKDNGSFADSQYYKGLAKSHDVEIEWLKELLNKSKDDGVNGKNRS